MRALFVANGDWYLKNFRSSTIAEFSNRGHVTCMCPDGMYVASLQALGAEVSSIHLDPSGTNPVHEAWSLVTMLARMTRHRPDVVFSFNPKTNIYALIVSWILGVRCVPNVSGVGTASELKGVVGGIYRRLAGFFYRRATHIFFQNGDDQRAFVEAGWVPPHRAEVLPGSGVDLARFLPHDHGDASFRFLMASRLITQKGVREYLAAARQMSGAGLDAEFLLAGVADSSDRAVDEAEIASLRHEPRIRFLGHVEDMPALLETIDCVVLPSYYPEGVPKSLIEAAAAGKIIVTTDTPGCREVVAPGVNGFLIAPRSVKQLVEAMTQALELSPIEQRRMQAASRELAEERFDEAIVIRRYLEVAEGLTDQALPLSAAA